MTELRGLSCLRLVVITEQPGSPAADFVHDRLGRVAEDDEDVGLTILAGGRYLCAHQSGNLTDACVHAPVLRIPQARRLGTDGRMPAGELAILGRDGGGIGRYEVLDRALDAAKDRDLLNLILRWDNSRRTVSTQNEHATERETCQQPGQNPHAGELMRVECRPQRQSENPRRPAVLARYIVA